MAVAVVESLVESESISQTLPREEPVPDAVCMAVPRLGHVLSTVAEAAGRPLREAVAIVIEDIEKSPSRSAFLAHWEKHYQRRGPRVTGSPSRDPSELAAWFVVSTWAAAVAANKVAPSAGLIDAEAWLFERYNLGLCQFISPSSLQQASSFLLNGAKPDALNDLLPYVLDPHGPGSRLSVMREPSTSTARRRKRAEGVFYTPADVAEYMAQEALGSLTGEALPLTVLDPACGTGVFLRAAMRILIARMPSASPLDVACNLYGCDVDEWALDASAFVLLSECVRSPSFRPVAPVAAWRAIRMNLANLDALLIEPGRVEVDSDKQRQARLSDRTALRAGSVAEPSGVERSLGGCRVDQLFPEIGEGPRVILGNPPYAPLGANRDLARLARTFTTFAAAPRPSSDIYPLFVEQMIRLAAPNSHGGALVLPLSIACNSSPQFVALRSLLSRESGTWRFAFFDREPHALFGEDVKTRNAIVLWCKHAAEHGTAVETGPLRKWRAQDRRMLFKRLDFTPVKADLRMGIPKVQGQEQAGALRALMNASQTLQTAVTAIGRASLAEAFNGDANTVYVGATAYNFINAFLRPSDFQRVQGDALSEHRLHAILCPNGEAALSVFAALSGNFAFWWWHIHGDGFHVGRGMLESLPIGAALSSQEPARRLATIAHSLWGQLAMNPKVSRNRGKSSLGFSAADYPQARREIDEILLQCVGIDASFARTLEEFNHRVVEGQTQ